MAGKELLYSSSLEASWRLVSGNVVNQGWKRAGSARCLNELGSARLVHFTSWQKKLGSTLAREPARLGSRAIFWYLSLHYLVN
jgi:hypothetical protein